MASESIREIVGRGRCVVAERFYAPGDLVLSEEPYAMVVAEAYAEVACSYCCKICINGTMYALSSDSSVRYCSEQCITVDYPVHSLESPSVTALEAEEVHGAGKDSMRLVFRVASCRKKEDSATSSSAQKPNTVTVPLKGRLNTFKHVLLLEANTTSVTPAMAREVSRTSAELSKIAFRSSLPLSAVEARSLLYSIQCNAHQIVSHEGGLKAVALGLFPYTSMMNHSCSPNCVKCFLIEKDKPPRLVMRAAEHIQRGEELCYSYVDLYQSTAARRSQLSSAYGFHCICERCLAGERISPEETSSEDRGPTVESTVSLGGYCTDADIDAVETSPAGGSSLLSIEDIEEFVASTARLASGSIRSEVEAERVRAALKQLIDFMEGESVSVTHPAHRAMFLCYHSFSLSAVLVAVTNSKSGVANSSSPLKVAIGYGLLALGCMRKYVRRVQSEIGNLEGRLALAIELLLLAIEREREGKRETEGKGDDLEEPSVTDTEQLIQAGVDDTEKIAAAGHHVSDILIENLSELSPREPQRQITHRVSDLMLQGGYLGSYFWAHRDGRVRGLLDSAVPPLGVADSGISSGSSSALNVEADSAEASGPHTGSTPGTLGGVRRFTEREERIILEDLLLRLRDSSARIAFICRAGEGLSS